MTRSLEFWDHTIRDGPQSLWATRITTSMMVPIARQLDEAGFFAIDLMGGVQFDTCIHYLRENPWDRMRIMSQLVTRTPLSSWVRARTLYGWDLLPDEVFDLAIPLVRKNGLRYLIVFDALNDPRNMEHIIKVSKKVGFERVAAAVTYTLSPVHTDEYFVAKARALTAMDIDDFILKDPTGLLTPDRVRTLVPALRQVVGDLQFSLHTHCQTGLGTAACVESVRLGVDVVHTATSPLAYGASNPPTEVLAREAREMGRAVRLQDAKIDEIAGYLRWLAYRHNMPLGQPVDYDPAVFRHQVPGGMISNLQSQLKAAGMQHLLPRVLEEIPQVRQDLGYPIMVSPLSQYVGVQALLNVVHGERYRIVSRDLVQYALGWYGELAAPINPDVLDRIAGKEQPTTARPADLIGPVVERVRREHGPFESEEDLVLAILYKKPVLDTYRAARKILDSTPVAPNAVMALITELTRRRDLDYIRVQKGDLLVSVQL